MDNLRSNILSSMWYSGLSTKIESNTMRNDVYRQKEIELMVDHKFDAYLKLMANADMPSKNKLTLVMLKIDEYIEEAKQIILSEAATRKTNERIFNARQ